MAAPIEYQKVMTEIVFINLPGPEEPTPGMAGTEILHGFLTEFHRKRSPIDRVLITDTPGKPTKKIPVKYWEIGARYKD